MNFPKFGESIVIGYRKFTSKKGLPCCMISVMSVYSDRDVSYGAQGYKVTDEFVPSAQHELVTPDVIGKAIKIDYEINGGRAYVRSIGLL